MRPFPSPPRCLALVAVVILGLLAGCRGAAPVPAPASESAAPPRPIMTLALCEDYPEESRTLAAAERDLDAMRAMGIGVLRVAIGWDAVESEPGVYDWGFWDAFIDAAEARGVALIPYVCYTPQWASSAPDEPDFWRHPPVDAAAFERFVAAAAARYRGRVRSWELWNEPDNAEYWRGDVESFARLVEAGARGVRAADPDARIVLGGIAWELDFLAELLREHDVERHIDVVNLHSYFETWSPEALETIPAFVGRAGDLIARHGDGEAIWMAELGYSDFRRGAFVSPVYEARYRYEHTPRFQADALVRSLVLLLSTGRVELAAWYRINDLPEGQDIIGDVNNRRLGVRTVDGRDKPAAAAMGVAVALLGGAVGPVEGLRTFEAVAGPEAEVHGFALPGGRTVLAAWLPTVAPGLRTADDDGIQIDTRQKAVRVTLPGRHAVVRVVDATGRAVPLSGDRVSASAEETSIDLLLQGPQTLLIELRRVR